MLVYFLLADTVLKYFDLYVKHATWTFNHHNINIIISIRYLLRNTISYLPNGIYNHVSTLL